MNKHQARDAVRSLLQEYSYNARRYERLDACVRPWSKQRAQKLMEIPPDTGGKERERMTHLARMAQTPFLGLVLDTYGQSLKVDNYFGSDAHQAGAWQHWQRNRMDARQTGLHRAALQYGTAYASVLPASDSAVRIGVHSPRRMVALYGEPLSWPDAGAASTADFPIVAALIQDGQIRLFDEENIYYFGVENNPLDPLQWRETYYSADANLPFLESRPHGVGATPIVRYQDRMMADGEETFGIIDHLLDTALRIDRTNYEQSIAQYWSAFKQRYVMGWMPKSTAQAMRQRASDTWFFENKEVKVGQFQETDLGQYISARESAVRDFAAVAQVPAQSLGANAISNISADGLAALETSKDRKAAEIQTSLGESHEQMLRLAAHISGDVEGAADFGAEVKWAETSARSFAQTVDGLGKLVSLMGVPSEELLPDIPGWSRERVERVKTAMRSQTVAPGLFDEPDGTGTEGLIDM